MPNESQYPEWLLPRLKPSSDLSPPDSRGEWESFSSRDFFEIAHNLDYPEATNRQHLSGIPSIWAYPLTFQEILYHKEHPRHRYIVEQWQGMLAAIALAEVRGFPLKAQLIELGKSPSDPFTKSLRDFLPYYQGRNLYTLNEKNPWEDIYVFLWNNQPVGMTSPSTLVVPSQDGDWTSLPWWYREQNLLESPQSRLNLWEECSLWLWLENISEELDKHDGENYAINLIKSLIYGFQETLHHQPDQVLILTDNLYFFGVPINRGSLIALNRPIQPPIQPSSVQLIPSSRKAHIARPLLIFDPYIAQIWGQPPYNIYFYQQKTFASLREEELEEFKMRWENDIVIIQPNELFLPELYFIDLEKALPGALLPSNSEKIIFNNRKITPLIPLNPILLDYLTPEYFAQVIQFQSINQRIIRVILDLPLTGIEEGKNPQNYRIFRDYELKEENFFSEQLPVLQIWPYLKCQGWKEYYAFYYDLELGKETFQVSFPEAEYIHHYQEGRGQYQIAHLDSFPEYIQCLDVSRNLIGLILLKPPEIITPSKACKVGVDFGSYHTNVYVKYKDDVEPLQLENLQLQVTKSDAETRLRVLLEYFIPEDFIPVEKPLPIQTILTTRRCSSNIDKHPRPIIDGRIYIPDYYSFDHQKHWIETNVTWNPKAFIFSELFLKHLALHITALALKQGSREIHWSLSYPTIFSVRDRKRYAKFWQDICRELEKTTGVIQHSPEMESAQFIPESLAFAHYMTDYEEHDFVYTTCIDLSSRKTDLSIWENNELVHQCCVQFGGYNIFSQLLLMNPRFTERVFNVDCKNLRDDFADRKLTRWLSLEGDRWLERRRPLLDDDKDFQEFIQIMAIGIGGLYYYLGIILRVLHQEEKYRSGRITPVYVGGNGSRFFHWLDFSGRFDKNSEINLLFSRMLSQGSGFEDIQQITRLSSRPKDEVAGGLLLEEPCPSHQLTKNSLVAGENCLLNNQEINAFSRLEFEEDVREYSIPQLVQLPQFIYDFHSALRDFAIREILPLDSPNTKQNEKFWQDVQRELSYDLVRLNYKRIRLEPPFILGLKALLRVLGKRWAEK